MSERITGHELLALRFVASSSSPGRTQEAALVLCWLQIRAAITPGPGQVAGQRAWMTETEQVDSGRLPGCTTGLGSPARPCRRH